MFGKRTFVQLEFSRQRDWFTVENSWLGDFFLLGFYMKENGKIFNRFEWNKIIAKSSEELKEKFPVKNLIKKK